MLVAKANFPQFLNNTKFPVWRRNGELAEPENLDPTANEESRNKILTMFKWTDSLIMGKDRDRLEDTIVEFNDIFACHRLDIGNMPFQNSLTPQDDKPVYIQSLPVPINLKEDLTVELALMHRQGIITTLLFSKYASPIFAQRKHNGKLRLLVDLRKINALIADDYINIALSFRRRFWSLTWPRCIASLTLA